MPQGPALTPEQIQALVANGDISITGGYKGLTDAELKVALPLMFEQAQGSGQMAKPGVDWSAVGPAAVLMAPLALSAAGGAIPILKTVGSGAAAGLGLGAANWIMQKLGVPAEGRNAVTMGLGFGMMGKGAAKAEAGAAMSAEEAAVRSQLSKQGYPPALIEKIIAKDAGAGAAMARPPGSNVIKEGPLSGVTADVSGGFQPGGGLFTFPNKSTSGIADSAGFDRTLEAELNRIKGLKRMPVGKDADYAGWSAMKDAEAPPASVEELLLKLRGSLDKDAARGVKLRSPK